MKRLFITLSITAGLFVCFCGCSSQNEGGEKGVIYDSVMAEHSLADSKTILSELQANADIATTEVTIRKIAIYDTEKSEKFSWTNPSTWKYGNRKLIIPVEVRIKYGYDLKEMTTENIKLTDDSTAVVVVLPKPKIIDAGYTAEIDEKSVVNIATGLRSKIGHELEEEIRLKGYEAVLKEDLKSVVGKEIEANTRSMFESIIKSLGWEYVQVVTYNR